ncbi:MAG: replication-associated recombination protein A [Chloroflexi bacterium]|nr:replication-associated recombination protein A [Chloroflexota bacterium]
MDLFDYNQSQSITGPLAARMRPRTLVEFYGQSHIVGDGKPLRRAIESGSIPSIILWGPAGVGKTTLARIISAETSSYFSPMSAVAAGVADLRKVISEAKDRYKTYGQHTILFIDEIHRFNKSQQDAVLPYVEDGTVTLIGATTENPSFEVNSALISRSRVFRLNQLTADDLRNILQQALNDKERGLGQEKIDINADGLDFIAQAAGGDARSALNVLEMAVYTSDVDEHGYKRISLEQLADSAQRRALPYDKNADMHYDIISALHKSIRGSDPDAALYYMFRMLEAGEDPLFIVRRLIRAASEDIGMADSNALLVACAAKDAVIFVGLPEADIALAHAVVYLATAPKSNSLEMALSKVQQAIEKEGPLEVPIHIRNAPTKLMKNMGYGKDYKYPHDFPGHFVYEEYLPDQLQERRFYEPSEMGLEKRVKERLQMWWKGKYDSVH